MNIQHCQQSGKSLSLIMLGIALAFLSGPLSAQQHSNGPAETLQSAEQATSFLIQAESVDVAAAAVQQVGGDVTHKLRIIRSVSARLTAAQVVELRKNKNVTKITADAPVNAR